jgi:hypothetical protein
MDGVSELPNLDPTTHNPAAGAGGTYPPPITGQKLDKNWQGSFPATKRVSWHQNRILPIPK